MTKKTVLTTVSSGYQSNTQINTNLNAINDQLDNTLSLDGSTPNAMGADLDLNGNGILNAGTVNTTALVVNGKVLSDPSSLGAVEATHYTTVTVLLASSETTRGTGSIWEAQGIR